MITRPFNGTNLVLGADERFFATFGRRRILVSFFEIRPEYFRVHGSYINGLTAELEEPFTTVIGLTWLPDEVTARILEEQQLLKDRAALATPDPT